MVIDCSKCVDTGKIGEETYCECHHGQLAKRLDRAKRKAERLEEKERETKKQKAKQMELLPEAEKANDVDIKEMSFSIGDYVKVTRKGYKTFLGEVVKLDHLYKKFKVVARFFENGSKANGEAWCDPKEIELVPLKLSKKELREMIDIALDARDKVWFDELCQKLASY